jgi:hypothetical protein
MLKGSRRASAGGGVGIVQFAMILVIVSMATVLASCLAPPNPSALPSPAQTARSGTPGASIPGASAGPTPTPTPVTGAPSPSFNLPGESIEIPPPIR